MLGTTTGTLTALNSTVVVPVDDADHFAVQLAGTWVGTVAFEATIDGTNWVSVAWTNSTSTSHTTGVVSTTTNGIFFHEMIFAPQFRVRFSAYTSGTATVTAFTSRIAK
jgi:hypothetical protein